MRSRVVGQSQPIGPLVKDGLLIQCAWCDRYQLDDGSYGHLGRCLPGDTSHTICPDCFGYWLREYQPGRAIS